MPRKPSCNGCCIRQTGCTACARCLPKYLCVDVVVIPGPYTTLTCCDVDYHTGEGHFSFRLVNACNSWSGSGTCEGLSGTVDLAVTLNVDCDTVITSSLSSDALTFPGVLPSGMSGSYVNAAGDELRWEVSHAAVVENPLIRQHCSPCSCATCLPEKLCAEVTIFGHFIYDNYGNPTTDSVPTTVYGVESAAFDCGEWTFDTGAITESDVSITVRLKNIVERICGIDFSGQITVANLPDGVGTGAGVILLEGDLHPRKFHGTLCAGNGGENWTEGVPELRPCPEEPCPEVPAQNFVGYMDQSFQIVTGGGLAIGSIRIRDMSCGTCKVCEPPIDEKCCPDLPSTLTVQASRSGEASEESSLFRDGTNYSGSIKVPGCDGFLTLTLKCNPNTTPNWTLDVGGCHTASGLLNSGGIDPDCEAFEFTTDGVLLSGASTCCLPDHPPVSIPLTIVA